MRELKKRSERIQGDCPSKWKVDHKANGAVTQHPQHRLCCLADECGWTVRSLRRCSLYDLSWALCLPGRLFLSPLGKTWSFFPLKAPSPEWLEKLRSVGGLKWMTLKFLAYQDIAMLIIIISSECDFPPFLLWAPSSHLSVDKQFPSTLTRAPVVVVRTLVPAEF